MDSNLYIGVLESNEFADDIYGPDEYWRDLVAPDFDECYGIDSRDNDVIQPDWLDSLAKNVEDFEYEMHLFADELDDFLDEDGIITEFSFSSVDTCLSEYEEHYLHASKDKLLGLLSNLDFNYYKELLKHYGITDQVKIDNLEKPLRVDDIYENEYAFIVAGYLWNKNVFTKSTGDFMGKDYITVYYLGNDPNLDVCADFYFGQFTVLSVGEIDTESLEKIKENSENTELVKDIIFDNVFNVEQYYLPDSEYNSNIISVMKSYSGHNVVGYFDYVNNQMVFE